MKPVVLTDKHMVFAEAAFMADLGKRAVSLLLGLSHLMGYNNLVKSVLGIRQ